MQPFAKIWRPLLLHGAKVALAGGVLYWLVASNRLDFAALKLFYQRPEALLCNLALWTATVLCAALRWRFLLSALRLPLALPRLINFQLIAGFVNLAIPGTIGGDGARFFYLSSGLSVDAKAAVLLSLVMDRICGMCGLFIAGALGICIGAALGTWGDATDPALLPVFTFVFSMGLGVVSVLCLFLFAPSAPSTWFGGVAAEFAARRPFAQRLLRILLVMEQFRSRPMAVFKAIGLSLVMQGLTLLYFQQLTFWLTGQDAALASLGAIAPVGHVLASVPLAPGGLGIGHLAFERLFLLVGLTGGANVFNLAALGQMALNLCGVGPYLWVRRHPQAAKNHGPAAP